MAFAKLLNSRVHKPIGDVKVALTILFYDLWLQTGSIWDEISNYCAEFCFQFLIPHCSNGAAGISSITSDVGEKRKKENDRRKIKKKTSRKPSLDNLKMHSLTQAEETQREDVYVKESFSRHHWFKSCCGHVVKSLQAESLLLCEIKGCAINLFHLQLLGHEKHGAVKKH